MWQCEYCNTPNEKRERCFECGAPRSNVIVAADALINYHRALASGISEVDKAAQGLIDTMALMNSVVFGDRTI